MEGETCDIWGIPLWLMQEHLLEMGGALVEERLVEGDAWRVDLSKIEDRQVGSLRVGQIRTEKYGTEEGFVNLKTPRPTISPGTPRRPRMVTT